MTLSILQMGRMPALITPKAKKHAPFICKVKDFIYGGEGGTRAILKRIDGTVFPGEQAGALGFDDKMVSKELLSVPAGMKPRFYYLWPPKKVSYFQYGSWQSTEVDWDISYEADIAYGDVDPFLSGVPVVKLDSWINPYDATAAMVWPADNSTANLFQTADATQDSNGLLVGQGYGPMRWVRPEFIRILKAPYDP